MYLHLVVMCTTANNCPFHELIVSIPSKKRIIYTQTDSTV